MNKVFTIVLGIIAAMLCLSLAVDVATYGFSQKKPEQLSSKQAMSTILNSVTYLPLDIVGYIFYLLANILEFVIIFPFKLLRIAPKNVDFAGNVSDWMISRN